MQENETNFGRNQLRTISMSELYENVYPGKTPIIDGMLYGGTYLFVGAPKIGKSFLMAQIAYMQSKAGRVWIISLHLH